MKEMTVESNHKKCLLLNADYSPFGLIDWNKAIVWSLKIEESDNEYPIEIIDFYKDDFIQGMNRRFPVPAVAKTKKFFYINDYTVNFSRRNILIRDNYTCQYCCNIFDQKDLTYDHVVPKSIWKEKFSPTNWTNIVTCCIKCNRKKGNKTPSEAKMKLKNVPVRPVKNKKFLPVVQSLLTISDRVPDEWKFYLPNSYEYI
jgi:hypothetical protein